MGKIVAIGGGDMRLLETLAIDRESVALTGKLRPRALFIPTASSDSEEYWDAFRNVYGAELGCDTDVLYLLKSTPTRKEIEGKILSADLIYVGGGNTLKMMRRWRRLGVDNALRTAHDNGIVLSGLSAGCICWFSYGHSDSMSFYHPDRWSYIRVRGMGFIAALGCPHYNSETAGVKREQDFQQMIKRFGGIGIAIDDNCALEVVDGRYRVIASQADAGAYRVYRRRGDAVVEPIQQKDEFTAISSLFNKPGGSGG